MICEGRLSFPNLFDTAVINGNDTGKYQITLMVSKEEDAVIEEIRKLCREKARDKWGDKIPSGLDSPIRDGDADDAREEYAGHWYMRMKSKQPPGIVDQQLNPITDPTFIRSGDHVKVSFGVFAYDTSGNRGAGLGLNNVQFVQKGEPLGGARRPEDEFEAIDVEHGREDAGDDFGEIAF